MQHTYLKKVTSALCALVVSTAALVSTASANPTIVHASWYGAKFHNKQMAGGKLFDMHDATIAAHKDLLIGTKIRVRNPRNNVSLDMVVQDRGPFVKGRDIDLSRAAAEKLGFREAGTAVLEMEILEKPGHSQ